MLVNGFYNGGKWYDIYMVIHVNTIKISCEHCEIIVNVADQNCLDKVFDSFPDCLAKVHEAVGTFGTPVLLDKSWLSDYLSVILEPPNSSNAKI